jgi:hypothetical protein
MRSGLWRAMGRGGVALAGLIAIAGCGTPERVIGQNRNGAKSTPSGMEFFPEQARQRNMTGWVELRCLMGSEQRALDCEAIAETPPGWGFADAALQMRRQIEGRDGSEFGNTPPPPGHIIYIPVGFCLPDKTEPCIAEHHKAVAEFAERAGRVEALMDRRRCREAMDGAAQIDQPRFSSFVAAHCLGGQ